MLNVESPLVKSQRVWLLSANVGIHMIILLTIKLAIEMQWTCNRDITEGKTAYVQSKFYPKLNKVYTDIIYASMTNSMFAPNPTPFLVFKVPPWHISSYPLLCWLHQFRDPDCSTTLHFPGKTLYTGLIVSHLTWQGIAIEEEITLPFPGHSGLTSWLQCYSEQNIQFSWIYVPMVFW